MLYFIFFIPNFIIDMFYECCLKLILLPLEHMLTYVSFEILIYKNIIKNSYLHKYNLNYITSYNHIYEFIYC